MVIPPIMVIDRALRDAGIPIDGVSIGDPLDRTTWKAFYQPSATPAQTSQGDAILATVNPQDPTILSEIKADTVTAGSNQEFLRALTQATFELVTTPANFPTLVSFRTRIRTLWQSFL